MVVRYDNCFKWIVSDQSWLLTSKFLFLLYHFLGIKQKLFISFHVQTYGQTKRQNSIIETYLQDFVNRKENIEAILPSPAEYAYNNIKNVNTGYMFFKLNCSYNPHMFFEDKVNSHLRLLFINKMVKQLRSICQQNLLYS